jgi:hypothetical protein
MLASNETSLVVVADTFITEFSDAKQDGSNDAQEEQPLVESESGCSVVPAIPGMSSNKITIPLPIKQAEKRVKPDNQEQEENDPGTISILVFDPENPEAITEPQTQEAMKNLGIEENELKMPGIEELEAINDEELEHIFITHHRRRIDRLISDIKDERKRVIRCERAEREKFNSREGVRRESSKWLEFEERQTEKLEKQQKRRIEAEISNILREEEQKADSEQKEAKYKQIREEIMRKRFEESEKEKKQRAERLAKRAEIEAQLAHAREEKRQRALLLEEHRLLVLQQKQDEKAQKLKEDEEKRREKAKKNREKRSELEESHTAQIREREAQEDLRIEEIFRRRFENNQKRIEKSRAKSAHKERLLSDLRTREYREIDTVRKNSDDRELQWAVCYSSFQKRQQDKRNGIRQQHEQRLMKYRMQRERIDKKFYDKRMKSVETDTEIAERLANRKKEKEREARKKAFIDRLKKEERDQNALHIERQRKVRSERQSRKLVAGEQRIASIEWDRQRKWERQQRDMIMMENVRVKMQRKFKENIGTKGSLEVLRGIAREYGVDIDEMMERGTRNASPGPSSRSGNRRT